MKTKVKMKWKGQEHGEWKAGEEGYIDGYVRGADSRPYLAVVLRDRIILCEHFDVIVIPQPHPTENIN